MYNSYTALPQIPYNILAYLAQYDEIIWKLLKYNDYDALKKPDIPVGDKLSLIWKTGPQEDYSIFLTRLIEDAIAESKCILKCYSSYIHASELYTSVIVFGFDFLYGGQMSLVDYNGIPVYRGDLFVNRILEVLNGADIGGVGKLTFFDNMSRYDYARSVLGNSKTFTGEQIFLSVLAGDSGVTEPCGT